jgi:hypothetical protein
VIAVGMKSLDPDTGIVATLSNRKAWSWKAWSLETLPNLFDANISLKFITVL